MSNRSDVGIICFIDLKHQSLAAESVSFSWAKHFECPVTFVHVEEESQAFKEVFRANKEVFRAKDLIERFPTFIPHLLESANKRLKAHLEKIVREQKSHPPYSCEVRSGHPKETIPHLIHATKNAAHLGVIAKKRRNFLQDFFLGSNAEDILNDTALPILLVPDDKKFQGWHPKHIVVATDLSQSNQKSLGWAARLAKRFDAKIKLVHVDEPFSVYLSASLPIALISQPEFTVLYQNELSANLYKESTTCPVEPERISTQLVSGSPIEVLSQMGQEQSDTLLIIESHRHVGKLGKLARALARSAAFPVLFVPYHDGGLPGS